LEDEGKVAELHTSDDGHSKCSVNQKWIKDHVDQLQGSASTQEVLPRHAATTMLEL